MDSSRNNFVTDTYKTPLIQVVTWFLLASAVVCALARFYTKHAVVKYTSLDDSFILVSLLFLIGQSIAVTLETTNGLGKQAQDLSDAQVQAILKGQYAQMMLYAPSLVFSKLPTLVLLKTISPFQNYRFILGSAILIIAWAVSSELVTAFRCHLPNVWDVLHSTCIDMSVFITYFEVVNAFTEVLLMAVPFVIVMRVQSTWRRKFSVLFIFWARLLPLGAILAKIIINWQIRNDDDYLFSTWTTVICTQVIQFLSFMASCMLYLRPFLESLSSGFMVADDLRRRGQLRPYMLQVGDLDMAKTESYAQNADSDETRDRGRGRDPRERSLPRMPERGRRRDRPDTADEIHETFSDGETTLRSEGPSRMGVGDVASSIGKKDGRDSRSSAAGGLSLRGRMTTPLGENNLPRVSVVYTPLEESENIASFMTPKPESAQLDT